MSKNIIDQALKREVEPDASILDQLSLVVAQSEGQLATAKAQNMHQARMEAVRIAVDCLKTNRSMMRADMGDATGGGGNLTAEGIIEFAQTLEAYIKGDAADAG